MGNASVRFHRDIYFIFCFCRLFLIRVCAPPEPEGLIVLTYKANGRIYHTRIYQILETLPTRHQTIVLSVDYGHTKFYDLEQLVHYYQLNAGCLIGRLTHYIVNGPEALQIEGSDSDEDSL